MPKAAPYDRGSVRAEPLQARKPDTRGRRKEANPESYLFRVVINDVSDPIVERYICVPCDFSFSKFAAVLITSFGWSRLNEHMWSFDVESTDGEVLLDASLTPWLQLPHSCSQERSQRLRSIKANFAYDAEVKSGLEEMALAQGQETSDVRVARSYSLRKMFEEHLQTDTAPLSIMFEYDLSAGWEHQIELLGLASSTERVDRGFPAKQQVFCYGGQGHPIAEDCGGIEGWRDVKEIFADPEKEHGLSGIQLYRNQMRHSLDKDLDPYAFSEIFVNAQLKRLSR